MPRDPAQLKQTEAAKAAPGWDAKIEKYIVSLHCVLNLGWQWKDVRAPGFYEYSTFTVLDPVIIKAGAVSGLHPTPL